ncbi:MAG: 30S ribosomal protein S4 [Verrucomicrobiota bacterium]|nr:30S ribosomal protein S4 [Verrucomicrobiota bacterium]
MSRYTGPKTKISRRFGVPLFGPSKALERKNYPPGIHGPKLRRKNSDYAVALAEKQKLRFQYGMMEKQFRIFFERAKKKRGVTGETLLQMLETRLDNFIYRTGFATTRRGARQMVNHGHVKVNGRKSTICSFQVKQGDVVEVKDTPRSRQLATKSIEGAPSQVCPDWISLDKEKFKATVNRIPSRDEIQVNINEQLIVEFYSR